MVELLGREKLEKAAPTYVWTQPSLGAKLLMDVMEESVFNELRRICPEVAQGYAISSTDEVEIAGLLTTEIDPTVKQIYTKMKNEFCSQNDEAIEAIDERIKKLLDADSPQTLVNSLRKRADAYDNRKTLSKEPVADNEQVRKALKELRGIPPLGHFITYLTTESLRQGGAGEPKTLLALADEFEKYANKDPRIKEQLTSREGRGYAALKDGAGSAGQSASQSAGRSASSSPGRGERKAGFSSPGQQRDAAGSVPFPREIKESIRKLRKQLMDEADKKKLVFCPVCLVEKHDLGHCWVAEKARKEAADADNKKDGTNTGQGAGDRGGRGRRNRP
jgi:hypothetical protein